VGTVIVAVAAGLGGGYLAANVVNQPSGVSKLERRMSAEPIHVATAPAEPVPNVVTTNPAPAPALQQPQPQTDAAAPPATAAPSTNTTRAEEKAASEEKTANNVAAARPTQLPLQSVKSVEQTAAPRDALARARDVDVKRADAEKRRAERRQRWADKRRVQPSREQELEAVEESVREVTEPRRIRIRQESEPREMFAEPVRGETSRIRLFDQDN
jgi:hypothetical protein